MTVDVSAAQNITGCNDVGSGSDGHSASAYGTGVFIAFLGSTGEQLGLTLWKLAENRVQSRLEASKRKQAALLEKNAALSPASRPDSLTGNVNSIGEAPESHLSAPRSNGDISPLDRAESEISAFSPGTPHTAKSNHEVEGVNPLSTKTARRDSAVAQQANVTEAFCVLRDSSGELHKPNSMEAFASGTPAHRVESEYMEEGEESENKSSGLRVWCIENDGLLRLVAVIMFALGNGLNFVALGMIQESIVTLIGAWALVINVATAKFLLGEELSRLDGLSVGMIIGGICLAVFGNSPSTKQWCLEELIEQYEQPSVIIMIIANGAFILSLVVAQFAYRYWRQKQKAKGRRVKMRQAVRFSYMLVGGQISWFTVLFGKSFSTLILKSISGQNQFTHAFAVVIVVAFLISLPTQLYYVSASLKYNDALFHVPNFFIFYNLGSFIGGALLFEEMAHFTTTNYVLFILGVMVLFSGVFLVNTSQKIKRRHLKKRLASTKSETGLERIEEGTEHSADYRVDSDGKGSDSPPSNRAITKEGAPFTELHSEPNSSPLAACAAAGGDAAAAAPRQPFFRQSAQTLTVDVGPPGCGGGRWAAGGGGGWVETSARHVRTLSDSAVELMSMLAEAYTLQMVTESRAPEMQVLELDGTPVRGESRSGGGGMPPMMSRFLEDMAAQQPGWAGGGGTGWAASAAGTPGSAPRRVIAEVDQALYADGDLKLPARLCVA